jgi:psp operon transcriptional activator
VDATTIPEALVESELFGHEKGAFTDARARKQGLLEMADGGSLFLDEVATMSPRLQEKLLRLVEYGEFERLGGQQTLQVDVRVIAATNVDLQEQAAKGLFRSDLLDRLSFDVVHLPALRQRAEDIPELAQHFAVQMCAELGWDLFAGFSSSAMETLLRHQWPGNVRELKNAVERSLYRWNNPQAPVAEIVIDPFRSPYADELPAPQPALMESAADQAAAPGFSERMGRIEMQLLQEALAQHGQNQRRAAGALGLSYDQMRHLVRKHQLPRRRRRAQ